MSQGSDANTAKLTILHSNDMHGDFSPENINNKLVGGVSMLSGYVNMVRAEEDNVLYLIAGDMFQGSLIDAEYKGVSTIALMNMLAPDVATVGNHEVDYGLAHLLFLEKYANFPIINANMYIKENHKRLFTSHVVCNVGGINVLIIGVVTEEVLAMAKKEELLSGLITVTEAAKEIGSICDAYRTDEIDFTVVLTHVGIEADKRLAMELRPEWGVDVIIGGHSHTHMDEPVTINGVPIVQAACGTDQIGRFDIEVDMNNACIDNYTWTNVEINETNCPRDPYMEELLNYYKEKTDQKYLQVVTKFTRKHTHPARNMETELGRIFADVFREGCNVDIMFLASGSIRKPALGPVVTRMDLLEIFPFTDAVYRLTVTGAQLKTMIRHMLRPGALNPDNHMEFYQMSEGIRVEYDAATETVKDIKWQQKEIKNDMKFTVALQEFHFINMEDFLGISYEDIVENGPVDIIVTSSRDACFEWMSMKNVIKMSRKQRVVIRNDVK